MSTFKDMVRVRCPTCEGRRYLLFFRGGTSWTRKCRRCHGEGSIPADVEIAQEVSHKIYKKRKQPVPILYGRKLQL